MHIGFSHAGAEGHHAVLPDLAFDPATWLLL